MKRREFVKLLGVSGLLVHSGYCIASSPVSNFSSKRIALVIGNAKYKDNPLDNSVNDSEAISEQLKNYGFDVILLNDASKQEMLEATISYGALIRKNSAVGLFYYAGHAVQFDWKNFLVPVDALVTKINDVPSSCYDLSDLFAVIKAADNSTNLIILDACRDNPFGKRLLVSSKGLSQFDAPERSLLAYATAPGNIASDGSSAHGLYTEALLNEMKVQDAKIEDVLKRVRLKVRIASLGKQVPWETTSLESDFSFNDKDVAISKSAGKVVRINDARLGQKVLLEPTAKPLVSPSETQTTLRPSAPVPSLSELPTPVSNRDEFHEWQAANASGDYRLIERFLYKYPSGEYSMIAQARLDVFLREQGQRDVKPISSPANPNSKGTVIGLKAMNVGDQFVYEVRDAFNNMLQRRYKSTVTSLASQVVEVNKGNSYYTLLGNKTNIHGDIQNFLQRFPYEYQIGNHWITTYINDMGSRVQALLRITDRRMVQTQFGLFNAFVIEGTGQIYGFSHRISYEWLVDPEKCSFPLFSKYVSQHVMGIGKAETQTLVSFRQAS